MSAPVDVLALLSDPHYDLRPASDFAEARAIVAELVESCTPDLWSPDSRTRIAARVRHAKALAKFQVRS